MKKKQFISLAKFLREHIAWFDSKHVDLLADWCETQSAAFKRTRWLDYIEGLCGPNGGRVRK